MLANSSYRCRFAHNLQAHSLLEKTNQLNQVSWINMPFFGIDYIDLDPLRSENGPFTKIDRDLACLKLTLTM